MGDVIPFTRRTGSTAPPDWRAIAIQGSIVIETLSRELTEREAHYLLALEILGAHSRRQSFWLWFLFGSSVVAHVMVIWLAVAK